MDPVFGVLYLVPIHNSKLFSVPSYQISVTYRQLVNFCLDSEIPLNEVVKPLEYDSMRSHFHAWVGGGTFGDMGWGIPSFIKLTEGSPVCLSQFWRGKGRRKATKCYTSCDASVTNKV